MATKRRKPKGRRPNTVDDAELAVVLAHAATFGATAAAKEFGLAKRTIQRHQKAVRDGNNPDVARLIVRETERAKERNRSKLHRALEALLDRTIELAPKADLQTVLHGVEKIGDLVTKRQVMLGEPDERNSGASPDAGDGRGVPQSESEQTPVH